MRRLKVPHILSDSSVTSPAQSSFRKPPVVGTPSSSSAWDWENFYPPSPPDSEFFEHRKTNLEEADRLRELDDEAKARSYLQRRPDHLKEEDELRHRRSPRRPARPLLNGAGPPLSTHAPSASFWLLPPLLLPVVKLTSLLRSTSPEGPQAAAQDRYGFSLQRDPVDLRLGQSLAATAGVWGQGWFS